MPLKPRPIDAGRALELELTVGTVGEPAAAGLGGDAGGGGGTVRMVTGVLAKGSEGMRLCV